MSKLEVPASPGGGAGGKSSAAAAAASAAVAGASSSTSYGPRRSNRVNPDVAISDGDMWTERLAVCEAVDNGGSGNPKLLVRSYYRNQRTQERVWDEPPTGASQISHATSDMRKMALLQMQQLQEALDMIPPGEGGGGIGDGGSGKNKKKGGLFSRFRKKDKQQNNNALQKHGLDEAKDLNLQRAIARSMIDQRKKDTDRSNNESDEPVIFYDPSAEPLQDEDEALAMAKALSLSECTAQQQGTAVAVAAPTALEEEEEMLQRALSESRKEAEQGKQKASDDSNEDDLLRLGKTDTTAPIAPTTNTTPTSPPAPASNTAFAEMTNGTSSERSGITTVTTTVAKNPFLPEGSAVLEEDHPPAPPAVTPPNSAASLMAVAGDSSMRFDPYSPYSSKDDCTTGNDCPATPEPNYEQGLANSEDELDVPPSSPRKLENQPGSPSRRSIARRVLGGKNSIKQIQDAAGVV